MQRSKLCKSGGEGCIAWEGMPALRQKCVHQADKWAGRGKAGENVERRSKERGAACVGGVQRKRAAEM